MTDGSHRWKQIRTDWGNLADIQRKADGHNLIFIEIF